jgi:predicted LPLAT superfamily acyltransferase
VLPALQEKLLLDNLERRRIKVHAFQQLSHNSIFTDLFLRFLDKDALSLHAVEDINIATAVEMKEAIDRGEIVLMAADRVSAASQKGFKTLFFGKECVFPKGVFKFAKLMECPVYAISAVKSGWNSYKVKSVRLEGDILKSYVAYLEKIIKSHPEQWYQFYEVF